MQTQTVFNNNNNCQHAWLRQFESTVFTLSQSHLNVKSIRN